MNLTVTESISVITVFLQGLLSFFSPCVLPLLPLYIGYLSGGTLEEDPEGRFIFSRKRVFFNTLCFVVGVGFSFFLLGLGLRTVGRFLNGNQILFARIGGILVILFGLYQLGVFGQLPLLMREKRLPVRFDKMRMSPLTALLMGFVFSFAWTPCIGPTMSGVLLMAASGADSLTGFLLIGVYTLGFAIPFLLTGLFAASILDFFKQNGSIAAYTVKLSGVLLILMGILMITGRMNGITGYLSRISGTPESRAEATAEGTESTEEPTDQQPTVEEPEDTDEDIPEEAKEELPEEEDSTEEPTDQQPTVEEPEDTDEDIPEEDESGEGSDLLPAPDFTLTDQYGKKHTLSDYRGRVVFLNFWATWCPPCREEMPDIQAIYEESMESEDQEPVILGVAFPGDGSETDAEGIRDFLEENGYTYPVLMDTEGELVLPYYITAYPTTYLIDRKGNVFGYVEGMLTRDNMEEAIRQTMEE